MLDLSRMFEKIQKSHLRIMSVSLLILLAAGLLWFGNSTSVQADPALLPEIYFDGEYRIADGEWQQFVEGEHIPATKGDVTLRGNLHMRFEGEYLGVYREDIPIAFYTNHINLTFYEIFEGERIHFVMDTENPLYGDSVCGERWEAYTFTSSPEEMIEILIHNPHAFGNETAIDEMMSSITFWSGIDFEKETLSSGESQRNIGLFFVIVSLMLLGIAIFATLIHTKNIKIIWMLGIVILFAGLYFTYGAPGVALWSESIIFNTTILGISMMLYMFFLTVTVDYFLKTTKKIGDIALVILGITNAIFFIVPMVSDVLFYDTWTLWIVVQSAINFVLIGCLIKEFTISKTKLRWLYLGAILPLIAFVADIIGVGVGAWEGGLISQYIFVALFAVAMIMVLNLIPNNINAAAKAKELEMEKIALNAQLAESRISTMMSQIRPHFIYNTLGSIEQLCKLDPPKAGDLVHNFAKYLRGNFGELDNPKPILMSQEMEHVHHYISIENVRFPDMTFTFEMNSQDFKIPALTVQPIVENAIKHGLMKLPKGGTIRVVSYETDKSYCISVVDDGVGFDTNALMDDRKHVGLRNIRERLKVMVNGILEIESTPGVGTKVLVEIPKEAEK